MAYIVPRVQIEQEFTQVPVFGDNPQSPLVVGTQYDLYRYDEATEKNSTIPVHPSDESLGNTYQADTDVTYDFPNQQVGTEVDADFTKVNIEKAQLEYFPNELGTTDPAITTVTLPIGSGVYSNRFKATNLVFKTGNSVDRSAEFSNRDVQAGDLVTILDTTGDSHELTVKQVHNSFNAASSVAANAATNKATQSADSDLTWAGTGGAPLTPPVLTVAEYNGHIDKGIVSETYTVTVTATGATLDDARFSIATDNGSYALRTDQAVNVSDELILDNHDGNSVLLDFAGASDPVVGDIWEVTVAAAVVPLVNGSTITTSVSNYSRSEDITYFVKVVRGGPFFDGSNAATCARLSVTSSSLDASPTLNAVSGVAMPIGTRGATVTITTGVADDGLILGDIYEVAVTGRKAAAYNIIETFETLPDSLIVDSEATDITSMRLLSNFEVPRVINAANDLYNWIVDGQQITVNSGLTSTVNTIVGGGDEPLSLNVKTGSLFITHRDRVLTNSVAIQSVTGTEQIEAILGKIDKDNPIAAGVYYASLNAGTVPVYFCTVASEDLSGYNEVLELAKESNEYYSLVPLTQDKTILDAFVGHANALSTAEEGKWRIVWGSLPIEKESKIYDLNGDGEDYTATVADDETVAATIYSKVTVPGAQFITDGVRFGDEVRLNFVTGTDGSVTYDSYFVQEVRTQTVLALQTGLPAAVVAPIKVEVVRKYTKDEQATNHAAIVGSYSNRRVRVVLPETVDGLKADEPGTFVAAALAGLRASVVPHQGLTNTEVLGFTNVLKNGFTQTQLNRMAEAGVWIVTQARAGATPYVRHQLTTDTSSLNTSEDSITTNVDSISLGLARTMDPYIGKWNVFPDALAVFNAAIRSELDFRTTDTATTRAGNQLISYTVLEFRQHPTLRDRVIVRIRLDVPYPLNYVDIALVV